jgi:hypothetical protein
VLRCRSSRGRAVVQDLPDSAASPLSIPLWSQVSRVRQRGAAQGPKPQVSLISSTRVRPGRDSAIPPEER